MSVNAVLIVDDEPNVIAALKRVFVDDPYLIFTAASAMEGLEILRTRQVKVVISDEKMPGVSGSEFLSLVRREFPNIIRIILTGHASLDAAVKAINKGEIYRFLSKPWDDIELKLTVRDAVDRYNLEEENRKLLETVRQQAINLKLIERQYPGITKLDRDEKGTLVLPDISESEMNEIIAQFEKEAV